MNRELFFAAVRRRLFGGSLTKAQVASIEAVLDEWDRQGGSDRRQLAYILATAYHETGGAFVPIRENMNYSAERMTKVWPSRFKTLAAAQPYAHNPEKLANKVYSSRLGNGNAASGDGWRFRGGGLAQTTGRALYDRLGVDPDTIMEPKVSAYALVRGIKDGINTGRRIGEFIGPDKADWFNARLTVNADGNRVDGKKKIGDWIADRARAFDAALIGASYGLAPAQAPDVDEIAAAESPRPAADAGSAPSATEDAPNPVPPPTAASGAPWRAVISFLGKLKLPGWK